MKGSYILVVTVRKSVTFKPGSLPRVKLPPGCYVYVGSAMGPGGFEKRVLRHFRKAKKARWHIDYLTRLRGVWVRSVFYTPLPYGESKLTTILSSLGLAKTVKGFGATDSAKDFSHLLMSREGFRGTIKRIKSGMRSRGIQFRLFDEEALRDLLDR